MPDQKSRLRSPWTWIPTLYFAQGLPYAMVMMVSVIMYKRLGVSNTEIALYTSWLNLPWVIKPLWSPIVDLLKTRRMWIWVMQFVVGTGLAGVALTIPLPSFFQYTMAILFLLAFSSATHDIAADGFYMLALSEKQQAFFVGVRSTFFRCAMIMGQGLVVMLAGAIERNTGLPTVEVEAFARPGAALAQAAVPPDIRVEELPGDLRLVASAASLEISPEARDKKEIADLITSARKWNKAKGFYPAPKEAADSGAKAEAGAAESEGGSFWSRAVVSPLEKVLKEKFGPKTEAPVPGDIAGNLGVVHFHLSKPPGKEIVVTFGHEEGDKSVALVEGTRFVFNDDNWNQGAMAVIQLDRKLDKPSSAVFQARSGNIPLAWSITVGMLAVLFVFFCIYHRFILPRPASDKAGEASSFGHFLREFFKTFGSFFRKEGIVPMLLFLLFYRFAEAQLVKMAALFLLDAREVGGLALTTGEVGFVYGTVGIVALTCGGILGGVVTARHGLRRWIWWMVMAIQLPNLVYVYLSYALPDSFAVVNLCVAIEQFGYGFGFAAYLLYMIYIAKGEHRTAHYAICTGFMALGMMIPGMPAGWLQKLIGYQHFFVWVIIATIPGFLVVKLIPLDPEFGKKSENT